MKSGRHHPYYATPIDPVNPVKKQFRLFGEAEKTDYSLQAKSPLSRTTVVH